MGGFFWCSHIFGYDILSYAWSDSQNFAHTSTNTEDEFNETYSEGFIGIGNACITGVCTSTLYRTLVINYSLTKVNSHFKNDSVTPNSSELCIINTEVGGNQIIKSINDITNSANITTEKDWNLIQDNNSYLKNINIKCGNLGKVVLLNNDVVVIIRLVLKLNNNITTIILIIKYINLKNSVIYTTYSSITIQEFDVLYWSKIHEQAKALSKFGDTEESNKVLRQIQPTLRKGKLSYLCYYSTVKDVNPIKNLKRHLVNDNLFWPSSIDLTIIHNEVHKEQMSLVSLVETFGANNNQVMKYQVLLANSLFFRIAAVDKLAKSSGSKTLEVDLEKIVLRKEDQTLFIELVEWLDTQIKSPSKYVAKPIRRV